MRRAAGGRVGTRRPIAAAARAHSRVHCDNSHFGESDFLRFLSQQQRLGSASAQNRDLSSESSPVAVCGSEVFSFRIGKDQNHFDDSVDFVFFFLFSEQLPPKRESNSAKRKQILMQFPPLNA